MLHSVWFAIDVVLGLTWISSARVSHLYLNLEPCERDGVLDGEPLLEDGHGDDDGLERVDPEGDALPRAHPVRQEVLAHDVLARGQAVGRRAAGRREAGQRRPQVDAEALAEPVQHRLPLGALASQQRLVVLTSVSIVS